MLAPLFLRVRTLAYFSCRGIWLLAPPCRTARVVADALLSGYLPSGGTISYGKSLGMLFLPGWLAACCAAGLYLAKGSG